MKETLDRRSLGHAWVFPFFFYLVILLWRAPGLEFYLGDADHGHQLALGLQLVFGKFPFVTLLIPKYGPLMALPTAFGIWVSNSLIGETIICALGYATCLLLIYYLTRHYASNLAGWLASLVGLLLVSRFYKWYYWLFPLLALYGLHGFLNTAPHRRGFWVFFAGIAGGVGGLFRFDLGVASFCFYALTLLGISLRPSPKMIDHPLPAAAPRGRRLLAVGRFGFLKRFLRLRDRTQFIRWFGLFLTGGLIPFFVWFLVLGLKGGGQACRDYSESIYAGIVESLGEAALPIPDIAWQAPFSSDSGTGLGFILLPLTCALCLLYGVWMEFDRSKQDKTKTRFIAAAGLIGLGIYPQALHRSDGHHLIQTLPPMLIGGSILLSEIWRGVSRRSFSRRRRYVAISGVLLACYLVALGISGWGVRIFGGCDLAPWTFNPLPRYQKLRQGVHASLDHPVIRFVSEVQARTTPNDSILVTPALPQFIYFANRRMSGLLALYFPGFFDTEKWRRRHLEAVQQDPPALVITSSYTLLSPHSRFRRSQPELAAFVLSTYTRVVYQHGQVLLMAR